MKLFTETRVRVYARLIAFTLALLYIVLMWMSYRSFLVSGAPVPAHDFLVFYGAGLLAGTGEASQAHDIERLFDVIRGQFPTIEGRAGWFYPPTNLAPFHMLAHLPYFAAYLLWIIGTLVFFAWALRPYVARAAETWVIAAAPAVWFNIVSGQNAFLVAGIVAVLYGAFQHRPIRAGLALGLLGIKPHLGLVFPVLLLGYRRWPASFVAAATFAVMVGLSFLLYGVEAWRSFFGQNLEARSYLLATVLLPWSLMASPYVSALSLGVPDGVARGIHLVFCTATIVLILYFIRRRVPFPMVFAFATVAAVPVSPHNFLYDWVLFALPVLILLRTFTAAALRPLEWTVIGAVYLAPIGLLMIPQEAKVSPGFLPVAALYLVFALRCHQLAGQNTRTG